MIEVASPVWVLAPRTVPLMGSEAMLHSLFVGRGAPEPDYTLLAPDAGEPNRAVLAAAHRRLKPSGWQVY
ncbi:hypothetical protein ACBY01_16820 [Sphingomonas sp. ac-8]|uniref:hypothetical protein n=1 Tax=Sphingomonas sp. ac-8 TaxID=3242977 RepID=UPI003A80A2C3